MINRFKVELSPHDSPIQGWQVVDTIDCSVQAIYQDKAMAEATANVGNMVFDMRVDATKEEVFDRVFKALLS